MKLITKKPYSLALLVLLTGCFSMTTEPDSFTADPGLPVTRNPAFNAIVEQTTFIWNGRHSDSDRLLAAYARRLETEGVFSEVYMPYGEQPDGAARVLIQRKCTVTRLDSLGMRILKGSLTIASAFTLSPVFRHKSHARFEDTIWVRPPGGDLLTYRAETLGALSQTVPPKISWGDERLLTHLGGETATRIINRMLSDPRLRRSSPQKTDE